MQAVHQGGRNNEEDGIGAAFKDSITEPGGWRMRLYAYGECLPYADNRVTLNHAKKDKWGRPLVVINCEFKENEKLMHEEMGESGW